MSDYSVKDMPIQGKNARVVYGYKATMNDELNLKVDDIIVLTQCSEDETWLEGTLNGITGWFPSNYVHIIDETNEQIINSNNEANMGNFNNQNGSNIIKKSTSNSSCSNNNNSQQKIEENNLRIKYLNEFKTIEEGFLEEMCKFVKIALLPLQSTGEIFPIMFTQQMNSCFDDVVRCHQIFFQQLKEIPENSDAKIGQLLISMAPQFKQAYDSYAKINPKFVHSINKKREALNSFFESSISKMSSPLVPVTSNIVVAIYLSKFLATPFKQLEIYGKLLKEIQRYTEDYHVDRGDLQRSIEFYNDLSRDVNEIRKRKEYELDILSSKIHNIEENGDLFKNGMDFQFLSPVLIINDSGERKDSILALFQNYLIVMTENLTNREFYFEYKIPFIVKNNNTASIIQLKKININNIDYINSNFGGGSNLHPILSKFLFELSGLSLKVHTSNKPIERLLIVCSTSYDFKMWIDLMTACLLKLNKTITSNGTNNKQTTFRTITNSSNKQSDFAAITTSNTPSKQTSSSVNLTNLNVSRKVFSIRPHPPLLPHFQLPGDSQQISLNDSTQSLKRFMHKKPKLSEPFGKYHGADDDLKLLNVIESFCKTKLRQSVNINENNLKTISTSSLNRKIISQSANVSSSTSPSKSPEKSNEKSANKYLKKLADDKIRLESTVQSLLSDLNENKTLNKELKLICSNLSKQLEGERQSRRKLESYVKKHLRSNSNNQSISTSNSNGTNISNNESGIKIEHESSI